MAHAAGGTSLSLALLLLTTLGCGGGGGSDGGNSNGGDSTNMSPGTPSGTDDEPIGGSTSALVCQRDPEKIAERRSCLRDDDCPCGTHCDLGICTASCEVDSCAEGEICDAFGRCRAEGDDQLLPPFAPPDAPQVHATPGRVELTGTDEVRPLFLQANQGQLARVRVVAGDNVELACGDGSFATECLVENVPADAPTRLGVRLTKALEPGEIREVWVYGPNAHRRVLLSAPTSPLEAPASEAPNVAGHYRGTARLVAMGVGDVSAHNSALDVPLEARLYRQDNGFVIELIDPRQVLTPHGSWVGRVSADGKITLPRTQVFESQHIAGLTVDLRSSALGTIESELNGYSLSALLRVRTEGFTERHNIEATWSIRLDRVADLTNTNVPQVPANAAPPQTAFARAQHSAWEEAFLARIESDDQADANNVARTALEAHESDHPRIIGCQGDDDLARALASLMANTVLGAGADVSPGPEAEESTVSVERISNTSAPQLLVDALVEPFRSRVLALGVSSYTGTPTFKGKLTPLPMTSGPSANGSEWVTPCALTLESRTLSGEIRSQYLDEAYSQGCRRELGLPQQNGSFSFTTGSVAIDRCAELAERYDCQIEDLDQPAPLTFTTNDIVGMRFDAGLLHCQANLAGNQVIPGSVTRVCRLRREHALCTEATLCHEPGTNNLLDQPVDNAVEPTGGDPVCANGKRDLGMGFFRFAAGRPAPEVLATCLADLELLSTDPTSLARAEVEKARSCFEAPRFFAALGLALSDARAAEDPTRTATVRERPAALAHRLLQQWLTIHTFLAREVAQAERVGEAVRRLSAAQASVGPEVVFHHALSGLSLLLHPRFGGALRGLPVEVLRNPDPRIRIGLVQVHEPHHDHAQGLPVAINEALHALLKLAEVRLDRFHRGLDVNAVADVAELARVAVWVKTLAADLTTRAYQGDEAPHWLPAYTTVTRAVDATLAHILASSSHVEKGDNQFGIDENDLPLYFLGDESSASRRFSAISDFLIGSGPGSYAWVPSAIRQAEESLSGLREAWLAHSEREVLRARNQAELERELNAIRFEFGDRVAEFCSAPSTLDTAAILEGWEAATGRPFSAETCFRVTESAECAIHEASFAQHMQLADFQLELCLANKVSTRRQLPYAGSPSVAQLVSAFANCMKVQIDACSSGSDQCLVCQTVKTKYEVPVSLLRNDMPRLVAFTQDEALREERKACAESYPTANTGLARAPAPSPSPACFRGKLGEQVMTMEGLVRDIDIAQAEYDQLYEAYDLAMERCAIMQSTADKIREAREAHNSTMTLLRHVRTSGEIVAAAAGAVKDCMSAASNDLSFGAISVGTCVAASVEAGGNILAAEMTRQMEEAQQAHDLAVENLEREGDIELCKNDAEMQLVGMRSAALRIQRAFDDLRVAQYQLQEMKIAADTYYQDGLLALSRARDRFVTSPAHDYWIDEKSRQFTQRMEFAQRLTYLAVRAVEYEFQESLLAREDVVEAALPQELERVLQELWSLSGTRTVKGQRPSDLRLVISLKDELLQIADRSHAPDGEQKLSDTERFRLLLRDPAYAVFDEKGKYLGQRIPFTLAPVGQLGVGDPRGIPVLAGRDCAERLWSVNASIHGGDGLFTAGGSFARIELQKSNTFYSQYCDSRQGEFQIASVQPSKNLFRGGDDRISSHLGLARRPTGYASSRLQAGFNVPRAELESDAYTERASGELAARGLYGDYAVFLPAETLSLPSGKSRTRGLDLNAIDDILIRFDYVSVARP